MQQININSDLLVAQPLSDGTVSWTLASRLGEMLDMAEELFGPNDCSYTLLGIQFNLAGPRIWYRGKHRKHIIIELSLRAATDMSQACYEMAHETVHLLAPSGCRNATNFEEGVACYFAAHYMKEKFKEPCWRPRNDEINYKCALETVKPLLDRDICSVRRLRECQPSFGEMTKEDISKQFPDLTPDKVCFLRAQFE